MPWRSCASAAPNPTLAAALERVMPRARAALGYAGYWLMAGAPDWLRQMGLPQLLEFFV